MKNTPSLIDVQKQFGTVEACIDYLIAMRWPDGVVCPSCGGKEVKKFVTNETTRERKNRKGKLVEVRVPARHLFECQSATCKHQFSPTVGTIFHDTHLPLTTWFMAVALMCNAKKGLSAKQLERDLGVTYRTAWYLAHRIRKSMADSAPEAMSGVVEMDETYVGARRYDRRVKTILPYGKMPVFGMVQRRTDKKPSQVHAVHVKAANMKTITGIINNRLAPSADLVITDEARVYNKVGDSFDHQTVCHIQMEYVRKGDPRSIHTNSIENFWSLFKRGVIGSFHKVSIKHLRRYLDEFSFRFNNREAEDMFALVMLSLVITEGIKYAELTSNPDGAGTT